MNFLEKLLDASSRNRSLLCIGLDPDPEQMPESDIFQFNMEIIDATSDLVCAYKPNLAFYEALGVAGIKSLEKTLSHIPESIPVIGDAKLGDVASSSTAYARAMFDVFGFDAVTVNPYMGHDSLAPFLNYRDKGIFILCKTSNQGSSDFQEALQMSGEPDGKAIPLYQRVAMKANEWNTHGNVGLVVGATFPQHLKTVRDLCPDLPLLIPGIGAQGGDIAAAVKHGIDVHGQKAILNCSRQILYASRGKDFAAAARREASTLRDLINVQLTAGR